MVLNEFGGQEPGTDAQIKQFAARKGAQFRIMAKGDVNGPSAQPLWKFLQASIDPRVPAHPQIHLHRQTRPCVAGP